VPRGGDVAGDERLQVAAVHLTVSGATSAAGVGNDGINGGMDEDVVRKRGVVGGGVIEGKLEGGEVCGAVSAATSLSPGAQRSPSRLPQRESCSRPSQRRHQQLRETGFVTHHHCRRRRPHRRRLGVNHLVRSRLRVGRGAVRQRRRRSPSRPRQDVCGRRWHGRGDSMRESVRFGGVRGRNRRGCGRLGRFDHGMRGRRRGGRRATGMPPLPPPPRPSCARPRPAAKKSAIDDRRAPGPRAAKMCRARLPPGCRRHLGKLVRPRRGLRVRR